MSDLISMLSAAAGAAGGENLYIEDVFSTYLYTGTGAVLTITNGIDLDGEGGMVWFKSRGSTETHNVHDSSRGLTKRLFTTSTNGEGTNDVGLSFNTSGFSLDTNQGGYNSTNTPESPYVSWTFRKAPKFFDVVTYTGTGSARTVSHNLGSVPGCIIVKRTDSTGDWIVYHRANTANPETDYLELNDTAATADLNTMWNDTAPTSTEFTVGTDNDVNASAATYVAYLFAHDAGGFGDDGSENVISCGSYTGNGSTTGPTITLGYEPQWVLIKRASNAGNDWVLFDNMRGMPVGSVDSFLRPNTSQAEDSLTDYLSPTATGFNIVSASSNVNTSANTYIYIAIRRGPMKTPTAGTEVFLPILDGSPEQGPLSDFAIGRNSLSISEDWWAVPRLTNTRLKPNTTDSELSTAAYISWATMTGFDNNGWVTEADSIVYQFRRAPGFFDVVCYTGTGSATTISHNLGVVPELIIVKNRDQADAWQVYAGDATDYLVLNTTAATADNVDRWNDTAPTASVFTIGTAVEVNTSTEKYIAYLFASLAGISKVGSYTGNGSSVTVTTGFQPRFILVKRTDSTGNWIVGDSARGLVAADEPALFLNSTAAETTGQDWVDVSATGFTVNETALNANVNTATYIYLAIS
jgi:hypothetical protein